MAKTQQEILNEWINYAIVEGKIDSADDISQEEMKRLVLAAKRHERYLMIHELKQMKIKQMR